MLTRSLVAALGAALVLSASPAAFAAKGKPRAQVKPLTADTPTTVPRAGRSRVKPVRNSMARTPRGPAAGRSAVAPIAQQRVRAPRVPRATPKPSIARNIGWGTFWTAIGVASVLTGGAGAVGGAIIGGSAAAYNFIKAYLNNRTSTTAEQSRSVAFNAGWGAFWTGLGVQGIAMGDPLSAAIGLGAGAYNLIKAGMNYRQLPAD